MKDEIPEIIREVLYAQHHQLLGDKVGAAAMRIFHAGVIDDFVRHLIKERVRSHKIQQAFVGPFVLPMTRHGDFIQGLNLKGKRICIPLQFLNAHSLMLGSTGSGKTTKALFHALQIAPRVTGAWLFDCRKQEFRKIKSYLARVGVDLIELPVRAMRINPLQVPLGVHPADWIPRVSDMLIMVLELPPRASKLLQSLLHRLFTEMRVFEQSAPERICYPTLFDVSEAAKCDKKANAPARDALVDSLDPLLASLGPDVLAYHCGWPVHELARHRINFVLGGIAETAQNLILNTLLLAEFTSRVARCISNPRMDLYISVDEGQRILSRSSSLHNALTDLWPLVRGTGIGLDISIPTSHGLMPEALSFTATKYLGRCGSAADYETVGRSMGMTREQLEWTFHNTRPGRMIAQLGEGDHRYALRIGHPRHEALGTGERDVNPGTARRPSRDLRRGVLRICQTDTVGDRAGHDF